MRSRVPFGRMFAVTLMLSWLVATATIALAVWADRHTSPVRLATWGSLWIFTVLSPTLNALAVHRSIGELADTNPAAPIAELVRLRPVLLLSANMTLLNAFALILGR